MVRQARKALLLDHSLPVSIPLPQVGSGGGFQNWILQSQNEGSFILPAKQTDSCFCYFGEPPIIVPTCCSNAIFKVTPKHTHGCTAKLLRDDALLPHPQPAQVQKSCYGNHAGTRIFLTWFYILTLKGCSNFALPYTPGSASLLPFPLPFSPLPFSQMPGIAGIILHQAWFCGSLQ